MKLIRWIPILGVLLFASCNSIRVATDYDQTVNFQQFKTYAFLKEGVDEVKISDLDKKRILKAIDEEMSAKGYHKSENPDLLINIFTDAKQVVSVNHFYGGWGYGFYNPWSWSPWMWGGTYPMVTSSTEGVLYIDVLSAKNKELIWQGKGTGYLAYKQSKKEERIKKFVNNVLASFPVK